MTKKIKRPEINQGQHVRANPNTSSSTNHLTPLFCFRHLVATHSVEACERDDRAALAVQLSKVGSIPWNEIQKSHRHGLGCETIARSSLNVAIPASITEDASLLAFRFSGMKPMVGFRMGQIFHIVWLDREFKVYSH